MLAHEARRVAEHAAVSEAAGRSGGTLAPRRAGRLMRRPSEMAGPDSPRECPFNFTFILFRNVQ
jgi:hypothetical protein